MPWIAPNIGYVDNVGCLRCSECAEERHRDRSVAGDQWFGTDDVCECCGWQFEHITSKEYVQVAYGYGPPDYRKPAPPSVVAPIVEPEPSRIASRGKQTHYWPVDEARRRNAGYGFGS